MSSSSPLASFPAHVRDAHTRWLATHDPSDLDAVVLGVVIYHSPRRKELEGSPTAPADSAHLVSDLGYDSLALAEVVFFFEDLYQVTISNQDLVSLLTLADLRAYVRTRVGGST